jgi:hypothetical protein
MDAGHEIRMMMSIHLLNHFHGDARVAADLVWIDALDRQPSDAGVPRRMRHYVPSFASATLAANALSIEPTGSPLNSTTKCWPLRRQRRMCANRRGGIAIVG